MENKEKVMDRVEIIGMIVVCALLAAIIVYAMLPPIDKLRVFLYIMRIIESMTSNTVMIG